MTTWHHIDSDGRGTPHVREYKGFIYAVGIESLLVERKRGDCTSHVVLRDGDYCYEIRQVAGLSGDGSISCQVDFQDGFPSAADASLAAQAWIESHQPRH